MQIRYLTSAAALLFVLSSAAFAAGSFQCWTNKDGIRECGNEVPPEYSQEQTETLNDQGFTTKVDKRAKTAEEVAAEQKKKDEAAAKAAEEKRQQAKQAAYDRVLLATYLTEDDIVRARNRRTNAIDAAVDVTKVTVAKLEDKLKAVNGRIEAQKKSGKQVNAEDQKDADRLQGELADKQAFIDSKEKEKQATLTEYEGYIKRFRELKGGATAN